MSKPYKLETKQTETGQWVAHNDIERGKFRAISAAKYENQRFGVPKRVVDLTTKKVIFTVGETK